MIGSPHNVLELIKTARHTWRLVAIDSTMSGSASISKAAAAAQPWAAMVTVRGNNGALAVSEPLLEHINDAPSRRIAEE